jgi:hypothetical protein
MHLSKLVIDIIIIIFEAFKLDKQIKTDMSRTAVKLFSMNDYDIEMRLLNSVWRPETGSITFLYMLTWVKWYFRCKPESF